MAGKSEGASAPIPISEMTIRQFLDGYVYPHIAKSEDEGLYTRAIVLEEAARRLEELSSDR